MKYDYLIGIEFNDYKIIGKNGNKITVHYKKYGNQSFELEVILENIRARDNKKYIEIKENRPEYFL